MPHHTQPVVAEGRGDRPPVVSLSGLPVIPEMVDSDSYDGYARRMKPVGAKARPYSAKVRPSSAKTGSMTTGTRPTSAGPSLRPYSAKARPSSAKNGSNHPPSVTFAKNNAYAPSHRRTNGYVDQDSDKDYFGVSNLMRKMAVSKPRRWREKGVNGECKPKKCWGDEKEKKGEEDREVKSSQTSLASTKDSEDKRSVVSFDANILRKNRSANLTKYRYPQKFHPGISNKMLTIEENVPQCLRHSTRYNTLPVRQDCKYDPFRSVTVLKNHSTTSNNLPHPGTPRKRRPTSAPPGTMTSYSTDWSTSKVRPGTACFTGSHKGSKGELAKPDNNGSYHFVHNGEVRGISDLDTDHSSEDFQESVPQHVTIAVQDSDDDADDDADDHEEIEAALGNAYDDEAFEGADDVDVVTPPRSPTSPFVRPHSQAGVHRPGADGQEMDSEADDHESVDRYLESLQEHVSVDSDSGGESLVDETIEAYRKSRPKSSFRRREVVSSASEIDSNPELP